MELSRRLRMLGMAWLALLLSACVGADPQLDRDDEPSDSIQVATQALQSNERSAPGGAHVELSKLALAYEYADLESLPAGVAGDEQLVFVGAPLEGRVLALSRLTGRTLGELPAPPNGFILPFILHSLGAGKLGVLDAGGLPSPAPFVPAQPTIYEYSYSFHPRTGLSAQLTRTISFDSVVVGFPEDFVAIGGGRYLLSDAILGSIWIVEPNGQIRPGIVPQSFEPEDALPQLAFCQSMPLIEVGGLPFLFSGSTLPGVSPLAVRNGTLYFYSPCAEGLFALPVASLFDQRAPQERVADIRLVSPKPANVAVEQLLALTFNPYDTRDSYLYAADSLQLRLIRIDVRNGRRQVVANDPSLFNFPSSMSFLPPVLGVSPLVVVSNQQHRTPLTNDAISEDVTAPPFIATKVYLRD